VGSGLLAQSESRQLRAFAIANQFGLFMAANARISESTVIVFHSNLTRPKYVRFGWIDNPPKANLFNREGLPASPFRTDILPLLTDAAKFDY
jgi:sialate O-acetylesterase